jgi:hypothetical protein
MPTAHYRYLIGKGPFRGQDCRIIKQDRDRDYYEVAIRPISWRYKPLNIFIRSDYLQAKNGHRPEATRRPTK